MSVKASIHKARFKKLLKQMQKEGNIYYNAGDFIASDTIHISLQELDNLDELKPAIVEIFGHLEGDWMWSRKDKNVYDYHNTNIAINYTCPLDYEYDMERICYSGFEYNGRVVFDDMTMIPEIILMHDMIHVHRETESRRVIITDTSDKITYMVMDHTIHLTGNDIVPKFYQEFVKAWKKQEESDMVDDDYEDGDE